ncbi:MAG: glycosyltransferase family 2 protein [Christensenellaceae bacterium]|jgi:cellulose synthase/poly-beta-1,6-N-acetylglucosamine synthase-like glycosyltransferase|nr:glycosyltransferase family 2 protein [Christensenellaceae bacterium]
METTLIVMWEIDRALRVFLYILTTISVYRIIFTIIGVVLRPKKFKPTINKYKYAILIPARNEEKVIGQLIDSINKQDYIKDDKGLITVFVVADNCSDKTAEIARQAGAVVYERPNPPKKQRRKGFALKLLVENIRKDYGIETFDGYLIMDADNLLSKNYMTKMNDAFDDKNFDMFSSYSDTKNFGTNLASSFASMIYYTQTVRNHRAMAVLGLNPFSDGRGVLMRNNILAKTGFKWTGLAENYEFCYELITHGIRTTWVEDAKYFDEQPLQFRIITRQHMRWARGSILAFFKYSTRLLLGILIPYDFDKDYRTNTPRKGNIFKRTSVGLKKRFSCFDALLLPLWIFTFVLVPLYSIQSLIFKIYVPSHDLTPMFTTLILYFATYFVSTYANFGLAIIREHRKMRISPIKLFFYFLIWPMMQMIVDYVYFFAIFWPVKWKRIPHVIDHQIEDIYDTPTLSQTFSQ